MSAITESSDAHEVINVLFTLHPGMDALDFVGPLEVLSYAQHNPNNSGIGALDPPLLLPPLQSAQQAGCPDPLLRYSNIRNQSIQMPLRRCGGTHRRRSRMLLPSPH
jgi:hypothetical protein